MRPPSMRWSTLVMAAVVATVAAGAARGGQKRGDTQKPATLVRLDVHAIGEGGAVVGDLTADDFDVREDNTPQRITTFERVAITPAAPPEADESDESRPLLPDERARIVVIFVDIAHVERRELRATYDALMPVLDGATAPGDVIAVMTPEMTSREVTFSRRTASLAPALAPIAEILKRDENTFRDPDEQRFLSCYPEDGGHSGCVDRRTGRRIAAESYEGVARELAGRRREQRVVEALTDLTRMLEGVNDGRKAVLVVSDGWLMYRESPRLMRLGRCDGAPVTSRPDDQEERSPEERTQRRRPDGVDSTICEADRRQLAQLNLQAEFRRLTDLANRANVSFYPVAPDRAASASAGGDATRDARLESLRALAENTDGLAIGGPGALADGVGRLMSDLTSYYLIGYQPTNAKADGTYRRVSVAVNRRGVAVRARSGYRAMSAGELERQRTAPAAAGQTLAGALGGVQAAIAGLQQIKGAAPARSRIAYGPSPAGRLHLWAVAELGTETVREGAWLGGGAVDAALVAPDNSALASAESALPAGQRALVLDLGEVDPPEVTMSLRLRLQPSGEGPPITQDLALAPLSRDGPGVPLMFRRGPTTATRYVPTADPRFRRTERLRLELPRSAPPREVSAALLDRTGAPLSVAVTTTTREEAGVAWVRADLALAPLAHGDYVLRLLVDGVESLTAVQVVP